MEDGKVKDSTTWQEDLYWNNFHTFHFTVVLPPDFHDHLVLPKKFGQHMKKYELPDKVSLKSPNGAVWEVQLLKNNNELLFVGSEWKDFVEAHDLKQNWCLFFKFTRNSFFEIVIFEEGSSCEQETSYFVKKRKKSGEEPIQESQGDVITPKNGGSLPNNDYSQKLRNRSKKQPMVSEIELITPSSGESNRSSDHSKKSKPQSEKEPSGNGSVEKQTKSSKPRGRRGHPKKLK